MNNTYRIAKKKLDLPLPLRPTSECLQGGCTECGRELDDDAYGVVVVFFPAVQRCLHSSCTTGQQQQHFSNTTLRLAVDGAEATRSCDWPSDARAAMCREGDEKKKKEREMEKCCHSGKDSELSIV